MPHNASAAVPAFWPVLRPISLKCTTRAFRGETGPHPIFVFSVLKNVVRSICWFSASSAKTHLALRLVPLARTITMKTVLSEMIRISASAATTIASCPYDARWSHPITGLPMKCISPGCMEMINEGKQPACVQACPAEARLFGDILDPQSEISKKIASSRTELLMPNKGTKPNFFVVVSK